MRHLLLTRAFSALLLWVGALCLGACAPESAPGEVMLRVSTNLSIPTDADTLQVSVQRVGESTPLWCESYALAGDAAAAPGAERLPGTVALVSSNGVRGSVHVHLALLRGGCDPAVCAGCRADGAAGVVRVQRDAELELPKQGLKQLAMPLDFLCAEGSSPTPCPVGTTCHAGECINAKVADAAQLPDFLPDAPAPPAACFDVLSCFGGINGANSTVPEPNPALDGRCSVKNSAAQGALNVNVALVVNTSLVGNYGACDPASAKCLVPLDHGPGGWQTLTDSNQVPVAIGLPDAVCRAVGKGVLGVAISRASANCAANSASAGLCPTPDVCVQANGIACPSDWPGFSCGAAPSPSVASNAYCGQVGTAPASGPVVPGLWCCSNDTAVHTNPLLIDDMSAGPLIKLPVPRSSKQVAAGNWYTGADDINADLSPPLAPALFTYRAIEPALTLPDGPTIQHAACLSSTRGIKGYVALEGFNFFVTLPNFEPVPFDVTPYTGISFWAYAAPGKIVDDAGNPVVPTQVRVTFPNADTFTENTSTCVTQAGRDQCDHFGKLLTLTNGWVHYFVRWSEVAQGSFGLQIPTGFDQTKVYATGFEFQGPGPSTRSLPFDFCVAQLEFTVD